MNDELIQVMAIATQIACTVIGRPGQAALRASLDQACDTPPAFGWDRRAAAHAGFFTALADAAGDLCVAPVLNHGAGFAYDLMIGAGRAADGIIVNSRRRMLAYICSGDAEQAALEMEKHLRILRFMSRMAISPGHRALGQSGTRADPRHPGSDPCSLLVQDPLSPKTGLSERARLTLRLPAIACRTCPALGAGAIYRSA